MLLGHNMLYCCVAEFPLYLQWMDVLQFLLTKPQHNISTDGKTVLELSVLSPTTSVSTSGSGLSSSPVQITSRYYQILSPPPQNAPTIEPWALNLDLWQETRSAALIRTSTPAGTPPGCPTRLASTTKASGKSWRPSSSYHSGESTTNICWLLLGARGSPSLTTSISGSRSTWRRWGWCLASSLRVGVTPKSGLPNTASSIAP